MGKKSYRKNALSIDQQLDLLESRNMDLGNKDKAYKFFQNNNYYRVSGYSYPFRGVNEDGTRRDHFEPGTNFDTVSKLYRFDHQLRHQVFEGIAHIEVAIRTHIAYHIGMQCGAHAHTKKDFFKDQNEGRKILEKLKGSITESREPFIKHYNNTYKEDTPPIWVIIEILSLGELSVWYSQLKNKKINQTIASFFDCDEKQFASILGHLAYVRNVCAHHARLWNRELTKTLSNPKSKPLGLKEQCHSNDSNRLDNKVYNTLLFMLHLLNKIEADEPWRTRLLELLKNHDIDIKLMGFPNGWQDFPLWKSSPPKN